tara:strand:+ start:4956 stop:5546 length:591 start_codon:yes stop_codon:yes gene_type:complete
MALNLFNVQLQESDDEEEKCMICHEGLSTAPTYALPECKHTYHTHCIVTWFRHRPPEGRLGSSSDGKCPYCGNRGINHIEETEQDRYLPYSLTTRQQENMKFIKKYSKTANAPKQLTSLLEKVKIQEQSLRDCKREQTEIKKSLKTELVNFNETKKKLTALRQAQWRKRLALRKTQRSISQFPVIPIIIPTPIDIN